MPLRSSLSCGATKAPYDKGDPLRRPSAQFPADSGRWLFLTVVKHTLPSMAYSVREDGDGENDVPLVRESEVRAAGTIYRPIVLRGPRSVGRSIQRGFRRSMR